ncbi:MAG TPA: creatininase family protein [Acetobacteraceae bacterium]|nr:creatininase family protein [Acetobacteraceae bacterium]
MTKMRMSELTGGEAREEMARNPVILLPMGSHEDQGPHAPMGDWMLADAIAERIAARATERGTRTLMAPSIPFGGADYFGSMPGGIALGQATLRAVISDMLACLLRHGLTRIVVINGHGGNVQAIHDATHPIWVERKILIPSLYLWRIGYSLLPGIVGPEKAAKVSGHGADPLTSIGMHLFPRLLRPDLIPEPLPQQDVLGIKLTAFGVGRFEGAEIGMPVEYHEVSPDGVRGGDPRLSSPETGVALVEQLTEISARFVRHFAAATGERS